MILSWSVEVDGARADGDYAGSLSAPDTIERHGPASRRSSCWQGQAYLMTEE